MAELFEIPLTAGAQSFPITLGEADFQISIIYREAVGGGWFLDIERIDGSDGLYGLPMMAGHDLLAQHEYKGFGHLYVLFDNDEREHPNYDDMGQSIRLVWSEEPWQQTATSNG
jgi:hypothetical protein